TSLRFGVLCRFTAFVAIDRAAVVNVGGEVKQVTQAVEHPAGWEQYATLCAAAPAPNAAMQSLGGTRARMVMSNKSLPRAAALPQMDLAPPAGALEPVDCATESVDSMLCDFDVADQE